MQAMRAECQAAKLPVRLSSRWCRGWRGFFMMITACLIITASATHQSNTAAYSHREHTPDEIKGKLEASLSQCRQHEGCSCLPAPAPESHLHPFTLTAQQVERAPVKTLEVGSLTPGGSRLHAKYPRAGHEHKVRCIGLWMCVR